MLTEQQFKGIAADIAQVYDVAESAYLSGAAQAIDAYKRATAWLPEVGARLDALFDAMNVSISALAPNPETANYILAAINPQNEPYLYVPPPIENGNSRVLEELEALREAIASQDENTNAQFARIRLERR